MFMNIRAGCVLNGLSGLGFSQADSGERLFSFARPPPAPGAFVKCRLKTQLSRLAEINKNPGGNIAFNYR